MPAAAAVFRPVTGSPAPVDNPAPSAQTPHGVLSGALPTGTAIGVVVGETMDSDVDPVGAFNFGRVAEDVKASDGRVAIPQGSMALVVVRGVGREMGVSFLQLALFQVVVDGRSYKLASGNRDIATLALKEDAGRGALHRSVHVERQQRLEFKLESAVALK